MPDALHGPARLLVADDNKVNRLLLQRSLEHGLEQQFQPGHIEAPS